MNFSIIWISLKNVCVSIGEKSQVVFLSFKVRANNRKMVKNIDFGILIEMEPFDYTLYSELDCKSQGVSMVNWGNKIGMSVVCLDSEE